MDGLALICNLHADGPLTLRRLRGAGIRSLSELERAPRESLAGLLQTSSHHARRFLVEARLLRQRLEDPPVEGTIEPLPTPREIPAVPRTRLLVSPGTVARGEAAPPAYLGRKVPPPSGKAKPFTLPPGARRPQAFESDLPDPMPFNPALAPASGSSGAPSLLPPPPGRTRAAAAVSPVPLRPLLEPPTVAAKPAVEAPRPIESSATQPKPPEPAVASGTVMRTGQIEGLDVGTLERLVAQGVRTYRDLIELTSLPLARRAAIPYTKLLDLRYHARQFLERRLFPVGQPRPEFDEVVLFPQLPRTGVTRRTDPSHAATEAPVAPVAPVAKEDQPLTSRTTPDSPGVAGPFV